MLGRNIGHFLSNKPNEIRESKNKLKINLKKFAQSKYGCIFVPAIKRNTKTKIMTNSEFRECLKNGNINVIYIDYNCKNKTEYIHTILKAGEKQVNLFDNFLNQEYKLRFNITNEYPQYKMIK